MSTTFKDYEFKPFINEALEAINFETPTEIQKNIIPEVKNGRDLIGQAQTGSGKTHAFLLPIMNKVNPENEEVQIVITAPSRELSEQLYKSAIHIAEYSDPRIHIGHYIGGTNKEKQLNKLDKHQPHIAIGTPGRLLDMINSNALKTYTAPYLVVDEADMTLDMGFLEEVDQIASKLPENGQMLVFLATIPEKLQPFLKKYMNNPKFVKAENNQLISDNVENWLVSTRSNNRVQMVYDILTIGQPYLALIFANTKKRVDEIAEELTEKGLETAVVHGGLTSRDRRKVMRQIHNLEYQYVVATDLAARGIDIKGVSHVINAEIPHKLDFFIHRVGRTGRNNLPGIAITLYSPDEEEAIENLESRGISFEAKEMKDGDLVDTHDRKRRQLRKNKTNKETFDSEIAGMAKKAKKNIKPGYKKKIERVKKQKRRKEAKRKNKNKNK